ncbi:recombinase family protein [Rhodospirillaceae bacterium KN72]|uniref:Recombinase family protein n=1 Tax=Pacificispira spongiicola TaxID=2729598 RepID=A0A7Y0E3E7_9PROT|nr:recombinase family protein [Pacificispira spongiicola]NMM46510.1 recombinase family protein [Pacificispira spongiicola]
MSRPLRVAIYARYSSDLQNPSSIDDQVHLCRGLLAHRYGLDDAHAVFTDPAISGATMLRPGLGALLKEAEGGRLDLVVTEGLDRLSRDLADIALIYRTLQNNNVAIVTAHEGDIGELHIGFKGTMNAVYLKDLREKVRRAHSSRLAQGRVPAGVSYGYRVVKGVLDDRGSYETGLRSIHPEESAVILRIFEEFAAGVPTGQIVKSLNWDHILSPSGKMWRVNTITGAPSRGQGILNNEMYRGWIVYNRTRKVVDPKTGKSRHVLKPRQEWERRFVPELQIISDELWDRAARRRNERYLSQAEDTDIGKTGLRPNKRPLTSLVVCGECGGKKGVANAGRYVCNVARFDHGRCGNNRGTKEETIKELLFQFLFERVQDEGAWTEKLRSELTPGWNAYQDAQSNLKSLRGRQNRLLDAIERGVNPNSTADRLVLLEKSIAELETIIRPPAVPSSDAALRGILMTALNRLEAQFSNLKYARQTRRLLSSLVEAITLTPVRTQRYGEHVQIRIKKYGWGSFFHEVAEVWPDISGFDCS